MKEGFELFAAQSFSKNFGLYSKLISVIYSLEIAKGKGTSHNKEFHTNLLIFCPGRS